MSTHLIGPAAVAVAAGVRGAIPGGGLAAEDVTPGVIGFLVTFALVIACIPLFRSMTGKLRGVQHRREPGDDDGAPRTDDDAPRTDDSAPRADDGAPGADEGRLGAGQEPGPRSGSGPDAG